MKASVQLGLLCLSLLIFSLHGEDVEAEYSVEMPLNFEEPDLHQLEMHRVRRQEISTENENTAVAEPLSENGKRRKRPRPRQGSYSALGRPAPNVNHRIKRQDKVKNSKRKRPGIHSSLGGSGAAQPQQTV